MSWPIPDFKKVEYPEPISVRFWLPALVALALAAVAAVLFFWPQGKPTNTYQFWCTLVGAPFITCLLTFGYRVDRWEKDQTNAEETERNQVRLKTMWRGWTRRHLCVIEAAAFPAATSEIACFAEAKDDLPTNNGRSVTFDWTKDRGTAFRCARLLHLIARRFADKLRLHKEVFVTLMLDDASLAHDQDWTAQLLRIFTRLIPQTTFHVDVQSAKNGVDWITRHVDLVDSATRLVIAAQLWADDEDKQQHEFSEGAAAFLTSPDAAQAGFIFRPMTSPRDTLQIGLSQIKDYQITAERLELAWFTRCEEAESTAIRSALTAGANDSADERLLDKSLGLPGPASGWIALAIAMEAMRGSGPQLVGWREPASESLYLCTLSPLPKKETPA